MPVLLVLDVSGQSQTAAAIARGFADPRPGGADRRRGAEPGGERRGTSGWRATRSRRSGCRWSGAVHRNPDMALPERHLGLVQAREHAALEAFIERLADVMARSLDLDAVLALAAPLAAGAGRRRRRCCRRPGSASPSPRTRPSASSIRTWRGTGARRGAELVPFSPLADEGPDPDCDACWLPGGYPELHAGRLAAAARLPRRAAPLRRGRGRCTANAAASWCSAGRSRMPTGVTHAMAGLLGHVTSYAQAADEPRLPPGAAARGRADRARRRRRCAGTSSTIRGWSSRATTRRWPSSSTARATRSGRPARGAAGSPAPSSTPSPARLRRRMRRDPGHRHRHRQSRAHDDAGDQGAERAPISCWSRARAATKADLAELRREICERYLENPATRDRRVRPAGARRRAAPTATASTPGTGGSPPPTAGCCAPRRDRHRVALLVWGDPSLYDSTLRILDHLRGRGAGLRATRWSPASPACRRWPPRHGIALNTIGGPVHVTTGRRLREAVPGGRQRRGDARRRLRLPRRCRRRGVRRSTGAPISGWRTRS